MFLDIDKKNATAQVQGSAVQGSEINLSTVNREPGNLSSYKSI